MTRQFIIQCILVSGAVIFYLVFTTRYFLSFKKNILFSGRVKNVNLVMMWVVPFIWVLLLKALTKSTPGSYEVEKKAEPEPFSKSAYGGTHTSG
jgi:hypothetical protein